MRSISRSNNSARPRKREPAKTSCEMCTAAGTSGLSLTNWIHARPITSRYWRTKSANEERKETRETGCAITC